MENFGFFRGRISSVSTLVNSPKLSSCVRLAEWDELLPAAFSLTRIINLPYLSQIYQSRTNRKKSNFEKKKNHTKQQNINQNIIKTQNS